MNQARSTIMVALIGAAAVIACSDNGDGGTSVTRKDLDSTGNPFQDPRDTPPVRFPDVPAPVCDNPTYVRQGEFDVPVCDDAGTGGAGGDSGVGGTGAGGTDGVGGSTNEGGSGGTGDEPPYQPDAGTPNGGTGGTDGAGGSSAGGEGGTNGGGTGGDCLE